MTTSKQNAYERKTCIVCPQHLEHKPIGRPRKFCSGRCRVAYHRDVKRWAKAYTNAILGGWPPPPHPYSPRPERTG